MKHTVLCYELLFIIYTLYHYYVCAISLFITTYTAKCIKLGLLYIRFDPLKNLKKYLPINKNILPCYFWYILIDLMKHNTSKKYARKINT